MACFLDINHLKEFIAVCEASSFQDAADSLFVSQSSLSKHIVSLEKELGVPLFSRSGRKAKLTRYGEILLNYARNICGSYNFLAEEIANELGQSQNSFVLGCIPVMAQYHITEIIAAFKQNYPQFRVSNFEDHTQNLIPLLRNGTCELAFLRSEDPDSDEFTRIWHSTDVLSAVISKSSPLAKKDSLSVSDLKNHDLMLLPVHTKIEEILTKACLDSGFEPRYALFARRVENIVDLSSKDLGIGLILRGTVEYVRNSNVVIRDIYPPIESSIYLCYLKNAKLSPGARAFIDCTKNHIAARKLDV